MMENYFESQVSVMSDDDEKLGILTFSVSIVRSFNFDECFHHYE